MSNCREFFLDNVVGISVHPAQGCTLPIPFNVPNIMSMNNCVLSNPTLQIGFGSGMIVPVEDSLSAKSSMERGANGIVYNLEIKVTVEENVDSVLDSYINIGENDHFVCLTKRDGSKYLCYSLPNTFKIDAPLDIKDSSKRSITLTMKSISEFIKITLS